MKNSTLESLVWVLIYAGLLSVGLGLAVWGQGRPVLGGMLAAGGGIVAAVGVLLIWVRSRRGDER